MGAKKTPELIPLRHPLAIEAIDVDLTLDPAIVIPGDKELRIMKKQLMKYGKSLV